MFIGIIIPFYIMDFEHRQILYVGAASMFPYLITQMVIYSHSLSIVISLTQNWTLVLLSFL